MFNRRLAQAKRRYFYYQYLKIAGNSSEFPVSENPTQTDVKIIQKPQVFVFLHPSELGYL